jgi:hypothetical protein
MIMAYTPKDNTGTLFRNDRKESDNHPNAKGTAIIEGVEYWLSAWTKVGKDGDRFQSISFKRKDAPAKKEAVKFDDDDDGDFVPF